MSRRNSAGKNLWPRSGIGTDRLPGRPSERRLVVLRRMSGRLRGRWAGMLVRLSAGFRDDGAFCAKPASYGRGAGYAIWDEAKVSERKQRQMREKRRHVVPGRRLLLSHLGGKYRYSALADPRILEAVGGVRVVAGAQALLSVYLLMVWVLTQFGQPFE